VRGKTHLKLIIPGCFYKTSQNRTVLLQTEVLTTIRFSFTNKGTNQAPISIVAFCQYTYSQRCSVCLSAVEISREHPIRCSAILPAPPVAQLLSNYPFIRFWILQQRYLSLGDANYNVL